MIGEGSNGAKLTWSNFSRKEASFKAWLSTILTATKGLNAQVLILIDKFLLEIISTSDF